MRAGFCCLAVCLRRRDADGYTFSGRAAPMISTLFQYQLVTRDLNRTLENTAKEPQVKRETEYYLKNIENIKTIDDFLKDTRIFKYAMKAFGLEDMDYAKAFMKKALEEGSIAEPPLPTSSRTSVTQNSSRRSTSPAMVIRRRPLNVSSSLWSTHMSVRHSS
ncbi:hypothetical protein V6L77_14490 [Pannonibacter sp. Pt2-lr]